MEEKTFYPFIHKVLFNWENIQTTIENKNIKNNNRPDFLVFIKKPIEMPTKKIKKCFAIELKNSNQGLNNFTHGLRQCYDKYKEEYYKDYKIEETYLLVMPPQDYEGWFYLERIAWAFGIGWIHIQKKYLKFKLNEQDTFKIYF